MILFSFPFAYLFFLARSVRKKETFALFPKRLKRAVQMEKAVYTYNYFVALLLSLLNLGCSPSKSEVKSPPLDMTPSKESVGVIVLEKKSFKNQVISNGKLRAVKRSNLRFIINGLLEKKFVKNGQVVKQYQPLAQLNSFDYRQKLEFAETGLSNATLELEDILLGRGYQIRDTAKVPPPMLKMACLRSGYTNAVREVKIAKYNLESTLLRSPFPGKIANLRIAEYEGISPEIPFCTLIDDSEFEVEFNLIEREVGKIRLYDSVSVLPFSLDAQYAGFISEINPLIDEHGMILVKARVKNTDGHLIEGMNVKVVVEKKITGQFIVPKTAIVIRQNKEVIFKYSSGKASWIYIRKQFENMESYAIVGMEGKGGKVDAGDTIIVSGNLNLNHGSEVSISE